MSSGRTGARLASCVKDVLPGALKTCIWMVEITAGVSFAMMLLKYFNILPWISDLISPLFSHFGLPGAAALAYLSGYFVNTYSAIAIITSLGLDWRAVTIIGTMVLCSHSMVLETAIQKKTGASAVRVVLVRTLSALFLGYVLNLVLPQTGTSFAEASVQQEAQTFTAAFMEWLLPTLKLVVLMTVIIFALNILQRILSEFGIMDAIARVLRPFTLALGLPANTAFLWLVANIVGLGYGAAIMLDEIGRGNVSGTDVELLNTHISVSHSNVEDLLLMTAIGGIWWIMLSVRVVIAAALVWGQRLELRLRGRV